MAATTTNDDLLNKKTFVFLFVSIPLVFIAWMITPVILLAFFPDFQKAGQIGDIFGSINALFSGLAFVGLIYTIHQQSEQLKLNKKDLDLTRVELSKQAQAQTEQVQTMQLSNATELALIMMREIEIDFKHHLSFFSKTKIEELSPQRIKALMEYHEIKAQECDESIIRLKKDYPTFDFETCLSTRKYSDSERRIAEALLTANDNYYSHYKVVNTGSDLLHYKDMLRGYHDIITEKLHKNKL